MNIFDNRIEALQTQMKKDGLKAYIINDSDPHLSEIAVGRFKAERQFFCPFSGEGKLLVTTENAYLYTDGRYWLQAEKELEGTEILLVEEGKDGVETLPDHIKNDNLYPLGLDANTFSLTELRKYYKDKDHEIRQISYRKTVRDLPEIPDSVIWSLDDYLLSSTLDQRLDDVMYEVRQAGAKSIILSKLDDIAWLLGYRGNDIPHSPVFYSYIYIGDDNVINLFINKDKVPESFPAEIVLHDYEDWKDFLFDHMYDETLVDPDNTNAYICSKLKRPVYTHSVVEKLKSVKGDVEISKLKEAQANEAIAILRTMKYIEDNIESGELSESGLAKYVDDMRMNCDKAIDSSFDTICAVDGNAAMMHYVPNSSSDSSVTKDNEILLLDTGGHYYGGTTDTTRTIGLNEEVSKDIKHDYTLALKAQIALSKAVFIKGTNGVALDVLAREEMWKEGLNYNCGTGHGVGYMLNVHEGPQAFRYNRKKGQQGKAPLVVGNVITCEPGVYKADRYGIRIENDLLVVPAMETEDGSFYRFETITYVPYDRKCIDANMLTDEELDWVNDYHLKVYEKLSPLCSRDYELSQYLTKLTDKIYKD